MRRYLLLFVMLLTQSTYASTVGEVLYDVHDVDWLPKPNRVRWITGHRLPSDSVVTAAYVLARVNNKYLLGRHRDRGWDLPGGHVDPNEKPEATVERETFEETGAVVRELELVAYQLIELFGPKPRGYVYPHPNSTQALYVGRVVELGIFKEEEDMVERGAFDCERLLEVVRFGDRYKRLFDHALERSRQIFGAD